MENIMVKMKSSGNNILLWTVSKRFKRKAYSAFWFDKSDFYNWDGESTIINHCNDFATMYINKCSDTVEIIIYWASNMWSDGKYDGMRQIISIPADMFGDVLMDDGKSGHTWKYLCHTERRDAHVSCEYAQDIIKWICKDKQAKNALRKALRDSFHYKDGCAIKLYESYGDIGFRTTGSNSWFGEISGGLVRHTRTRHTQNGDYKEVYFSVHT